MQNSYTLWCQKKTQLEFLAIKTDITRPVPWVFLYGFDILHPWTTNRLEVERGRGGGPLRSGTWSPTIIKLRNDEPKLTQQYPDNKSWIHFLQKQSITKARLNGHFQLSQTIGPGSSSRIQIIKAGYKLNIHLCLSISKHITSTTKGDNRNFVIRN